MNLVNRVGTCKEESDMKQFGIDFGTPGDYRVLITPTMAAYFLAERNGSNRPMRKSHARAIEAMIRSGEWRDDHPAGAIFDCDGNLLDGQHRMKAIVDSGIAVRMRVVTGAEPQLRKYLDTGLVRTLGDRVQFDPDPATNAWIARVVRALWCVRRSTTQQVPPSAAMAIFEPMQEAFRTIARIVGTKKLKGITRTGICAALVEFRYMSPEDGYEFAASFVAVDGPVQQARVLRDWALRNTGGVGGAILLEDYERALSAMVAHASGREVKQIKRTREWPDWMLDTKDKVKASSVA